MAEGGEDKIIYLLSNSNVGHSFTAFVFGFEGKGPNVGVVIAKTVCTPSNAFSREARSRTSPCTTSTFLASWRDFEELRPRVMARILYFFESWRSFRTWAIIELPCWPVAPKMARALDMLLRCENYEVLNLWVWCILGGIRGLNRHGWESMYPLSDPIITGC